MAANKDALKESADGKMPIHLVAAHGPVEVLEYLLDACPEAVKRETAEPAASAATLMHCVAENCHSEQSIKNKVAKARLLCLRYPFMISQRDGMGWTPLFRACNFLSEWGARAPRGFNAIPPTILALCEAGGRTLVSAPIIHPTEADYGGNGMLPLHAIVVVWASKLKEESLLSPWADAFRALLRLYPDAAGIEGGSSSEDMRTTPYHLAVDSGLPVYYRRLLLSAAPHLDADERRRLNWKERRIAMFLAFAAFAGNPPLLLRLRYENKDIVKHVVSFL